MNGVCVGESHIGGGGYMPPWPWAPYSPPPLPTLCEVDNVLLTLSSQIMRQEAKSRYHEVLFRMRSSSISFKTTLKNGAQNNWRLNDTDTQQQVSILGIDRQSNTVSLAILKAVSQKLLTHQHDDL